MAVVEEQQIDVAGQRHRRRRPCERILIHVVSSCGVIRQRECYTNEEEEKAAAAAAAVAIQVLYAHCNCYTLTTVTTQLLYTHTQFIPQQLLYTTQNSHSRQTFRHALSNPLYFFLRETKNLTKLYTHTHTQLNETDDKAKEEKNETNTNKKHK